MQRPPYSWNGPAAFELLDRRFEAAKSDAAAVIISGAAITNDMSVPPQAHNQYVMPTPRMARSALNHSIIGRNNGPPISVTEFRFTKGHSYDVHRGHSHDVHICRSADRPTTALPCAASGCYGCALCWRGLTGVPRLTRTSGIATGTSRERLASRDTSKDAKGLAILHLFR